MHHFTSGKYVNTGSAIWSVILGDNSSLSFLQIVWTAQRIGG